MGDDRLNSCQEQAVEYCEGPLLVLAGPGAGKTHVLTAKVAHLVDKVGLAPERILALTFTEKAAAEMAGRLRGQSPGQTPCVATFHSFCYQLVQEFAEPLGFQGAPRLLTGPFYLRFLLDAFDEVLVADHVDLIRRQARVARRFAEFVGRCHDECLMDRDMVGDADRWLAGASPAERRLLGEVRDFAASLPRLLDRQRADNVVSFGDLLTLAVRLARDFPAIRRQLQGRFDYILVDELQDNNTAQFEIVNVLAAEHRRICAVGDEDQCIYRFRGAGWGLVARFRQHWQDRAGAWDDKTNPRGFRVIVLTDNYRSTPPIIAVCQALIRQNTGRDPDKIIRPVESATAVEGRAIRLLHFETEDQERAYLREDILCRLQAKTPPGDLAILCRSLGHVTSLISDLRRRGVALEVVGEAGLFANAVVRELFAWLRALQDPQREEIALYRLLESCGITPMDQRALAYSARAAGLSLMALLEQLPEGLGGCQGSSQPTASAETERSGAISAAGRNILCEFRRLYLRLRRDTDAASQPDIVGLLDDILDFTGLHHRLAPETISAKEHRAAVQGIRSLTEQYQTIFSHPSLGGFLSFADLLEEYGRDDTATEPSGDRDTVKVMTVHKAKGCEFPVVYVPGLLDHFPTRDRREAYRKFLDDIVLGDSDTEQLHLEEERRVLYVALSRAQRELVLTLYENKSGKPVAQPSPFVDELESSGVVEIIRRAGGRPAGPESVRQGSLELGVSHKLEEPMLPERRPGVGTTGPLQLSAPALETFDECPRRYYYRYVLGLPDPPHSESNFGAALRRAIKRLHAKWQRPETAYLQESLGLLDEELQAIPFQGRKERQQAEERGREVLSQYLREEHARSATIESSEVDKPFELYLGKNLTLHGHWDRIDLLADEHIRIVIFKTGRLDTRPAYLRGPLVPLQALAVQQELRKPLAAVEVVSFRELKITARGGTRIARWSFPWDDGSELALTEERLDMFQAEIRETAQCVRAGGFPAKPEKDRCAGCSFRLLCEEAWGTQPGR